MPPTIGIAIPCYKPHLLVLLRLLDSIAKQTYLPTEVVVSCSSTKKSDAKPVFPEYPFKFKIFYHSERRNAAQNRNFAAGKMTTEYIGFFDADDVMHPLRLEAIKGALEKGTDFVVHGFVERRLPPPLSIDTIEYEYNRLIPDTTGCGLIGVSGPIHHSQPTFSREIFEKCKSPEEACCERAEDSVFCNRAIAFSKKNAYIRNSLSIYFPAGRWYEC
jgi:glycosyltransferase involved in cell wall biosynthesis